MGTVVNLPHKQLNMKVMVSETILFGTFSKIAATQRMKMQQLLKYIEATC